MQHVTRLELAPGRAQDLPRALARARHGPAPSHPAAGRGSQMRRWIDRSAVRPQMRQDRVWYSSQRLSSRSMAGSGVWTCTAPSRSSQKAIDSQPGRLDLLRVLEACGQRRRLRPGRLPWPSRNHTSSLPPGGRSMCTWSAAQGSSAGLDGAAQADAPERRRLRQAAQPAQNSLRSAVRAVQALAGGSKGDPLAELGLPRVARQQRLAVVVELGYDELGGIASR